MAPAATEGNARYGALPVDPNGIPLSLRKRRGWVYWIAKPRPAGKPSKVPRDPRTGRPASTTDPRTWGWFDAAYMRYLDERLEGRGGVGFVLPLHAITRPRDRLAGLDLDGVRDPESGDLDPFAAELLANLNTYAEVSPSGTGVKAIAAADLDPDAPKRQPFGSVPGRAIELYPQRQFFALTGQRVPGLPSTVKRRPDVLAEIRREYLPDRATPRREPRPAGGGFVGDDQALLDAAFGARNGALLRATWEGRRDKTASEVLLSLAQRLAFWTGPDPDRLGRLVVASPLFEQAEAERAKWDSPRPGGTWGSVFVVALAIDTCRDFHCGGGAGVGVGYRAPRIPDGIRKPGEEIPKPCKHSSHFAPTSGTPRNPFGEALRRVEGGERPPGLDRIESHKKAHQNALRRLAAVIWLLAGREAGGRYPVSIEAVARAFGAGKSSVGRWLNTLSENGVIRRMTWGNSYTERASEWEWVGLPTETRP
ncbi:MAG TPA: hypothetical protein VH092_03960 [Urbifossiella sp.]|jgi:hypothetical protein|nr:hypothetical protein [Urbifossiella sp.]